MWNRQTRNHLAVSFVVSLSFAAGSAFSADCDELYKTPCSNTDKSIGLSCSNWQQQLTSCKQRAQEQRRREREAQQKKKAEHQAVEKVLRGQKEVDKINRGGPPK